MYLAGYVTGHVWITPFVFRAAGVEAANHAYSPERYAKRKDSPGQMSLFGHDVEDEPRDDHGRWTAGGNSPKDSPSPADPPPKEATVKAGAGNVPAAQQQPKAEGGKMKALRELIDRGMDPQGQGNDLDEVSTAFKDITDEEAVKIASDMGLAGVTGAWALKNAVISGMVRTYRQKEAAEAGLKGQPKKRVKAVSVPAANPLEIKLRTNYVKQRGGIRMPAENEVVAVVQRPQSGGKFVQYKPGDLISRDGVGYVVQAAKEGYMRSGEGWKRWEQALILRLADQQDTDGIAEQQRQKDAESQRIMDGMMQS